MKKMHVIVIIGVIIVLFMGIIVSIYFLKQEQSNTATETKKKTNTSQTTMNQSKGNQTNPKKSNNSGSQQDQGFTLDVLISNLREHGYIKEQGTEAEASEFNAIRAIKYGNLLFVEFDYDNLTSYLKIWEEQKANYKGKELKLGGGVGPYLVFFLDNNVNTEIVKIFEESGGYYR